MIPAKVAALVITPAAFVSRETLRKVLTLYPVTDRNLKAITTAVAS